MYKAPCTSRSFTFLSQPCKMGQTRTLREVGEPTGAPQESTGTPGLLAPRSLPWNHTASQSGPWQALLSFGRSNVSPGIPQKSPKFNTAISFSLVGSRVCKLWPGLCFQDGSSNGWLWIYAGLFWKREARILSVQRHTHTHVPADLIKPFWAQMVSLDKELRRVRRTW